MMMMFLKVWIGYAIFGSVAFSAVFVWAVRSRQFTELNRQRYMALNAADSLEVEHRELPGWLDRHTVHALAVAAFGVVTAALWVAIRR